MSEKVSTTKYDEYVSKFISDNNLGHSMLWLGNTIAEIFDGSHFEIDFSGFDDEDLTVSIHSDYDAADFRERMHKLYERMREAHWELYLLIGIIQRRGLNGRGTTT